MFSGVCVKAYYKHGYKVNEQLFNVHFFTSFCRDLASVAKTLIGEATDSSKNSLFVNMSLNIVISILHLKQFDS